jgi:hypothetical protein
MDEFSLEVSRIRFRESASFVCPRNSGMPASTLNSKIKSLKIDKRRFRPI